MGAPRYAQCRTPCKRPGRYSSPRAGRDEAATARGFPTWTKPATGRALASHVIYKTWEWPFQFMHYHRAIHHQSGGFSAAFATLQPRRCPRDLDPLPLCAFSH
jgi:hypothetical protein